MFASILKFDPKQPRDESGRWTSIAFGGKEAGWQGANGEKLSAADAARAKKLGIPPAWKNVRLSKDPAAALQALGQDAKGRTQYKYSAEHSEAAAAEKWQRVKDFHKTAVNKILDRAERDMNNPKLSDKERDAAAITHLIGKTGFRIGSDRDTQAEAQAYGASTLTKGHVKVGKNGDIDFSFTGKKGVQIKKRINDPKLAKYMQEKMKSLGPNDKIFTSNDSDVRDFMKKASGTDAFTPKDFRTWHGTGMALAMRKRMGMPANEKEAKAAKKEIAKAVAEHLGNTPTVAAQSYISPHVYAPWDGGTPAKKSEVQSISFDELYVIMDEAVECQSFDHVPRDWRTMPSLNDDPDDEEVLTEDQVFKGLGYVLRGRVI